jgi:hypothetical protein
MKKAKTVSKETDDSRVYKMAKRQVDMLKCPICAPGRGCNRNRTNEHKNWKYWRKEQWKEKKEGAMKSCNFINI